MSTKTKTAPAKDATGNPTFTITLPNAKAQTLWEAFGITEDRMNEFVADAKEALAGHTNYAEALQEASTHAKNPSELALLCYCVGKGDGDDNPFAGILNSDTPDTDCDDLEGLFGGGDDNDDADDNN